MKKPLFAVIALLAFAAPSVFAQYGSPAFVTDSVTFTIAQTDSAVYASGDLVGPTGKYLTFSNIGRTTNSRGKITFVTVQGDTADATNTAVKVYFFTVSDTTGLWNQLAANNAAFQSKFQLGTGAWRYFGEVTVTQTIYGTTAGGATSNQGSSTAAIPYELLNGKLYAVVIANGAFEPKGSETFKITVDVDRQN